MRTLVLIAALSASAISTPTSGQQARQAPAASLPTPDWNVLLRPRTRPARPTAAAITADDLETRVHLFADDSLNGRVFTTEENYKATEYLGSEARRLGLVPLGENGTYFQTVNMVDRNFDPASRLAVGTTTFRQWTDYLVRDQGPGARSIDGARVIFGGTLGDTSTLIDPTAAAGRIVLLDVVRTGPNAGLSSVNRVLLTRHYIDAAGIIVAALDLATPPVLEAWRQPAQRLARPGAATRGLPALVYVTRDVASTLLNGSLETAKQGAPGATVSADIRFIETPIRYPARNVIAGVRGSDPKLRDEYVALGAHNDHVNYNIRPVAHDSIYVVNHLFRTVGADDPPPRLNAEQHARVNALLADIRRKSSGASARLDSIFNGADDDASGSMSLLEIAEFYAAQKTKPKRSLLFIWHVGEEEGLYGSEWFTDYPTVPRESIVAQINMDMVGRGGSTDVTGATRDGTRYLGNPDQIQLIGSRRLSTQLGDIADAVSRSQPRPLTVEYAMDAKGHPANIYCRSDHYSYARYGIPVVFITTGGHADYHQVTDEPQYVDYDRLTRVSQYVADLAARLANLPARPVVDKPKPDPQGQCIQ